MQIVLDNSVVMNWAFEAERLPSCMQLLEKMQNGEVEACVPGLWVYEYSNVLLTAERKGKYSRTQSDAFSELLALLPVVLLPVPESGVLMETGSKYELTAYDAAYLFLALKRNLPLATLDKKLRLAATEAEVKLVI